MALLGIPLLAILGLVVVLAMWAIGVYNRLVKLKVRCQDAWASIDVQLKRRYDLIPNLIETVKGYASHERETLEAVIAARQAGMNAGNVADQAQAENMISGALKSLFALSEAYPDLKANTNFGQLQEELSSTENKISFARQNYNGNVRGYNTRLESFPDNVLGGMFGFMRRDFFELDESSSKKSPQVKF